MIYRRCGNSGLKISAISFGLWHNFGSDSNFENCRSMIHTAFDSGLTNFDLANNYGPNPGDAEINFGRILKQDLAQYRDQLTISSKAGFLMWPGPFGDGGSRKYIIASCDQSLKRMGLEYVDIFYHHRPDPETPVEESMLALDQIVRSGKALYAGISNYPPAQAIKAINILRELKTPFVLNQIPYNIINRYHEDNGLLQLMADEGVGCIIFCPLAQGLLSGRYLNGIPEDSRAVRNRTTYKELLSKNPNAVFTDAQITQEWITILNQLNQIAVKRGQTLAQMAIAWLLSRTGVTSALVGASRPQQIMETVKALDNLVFSREEIDEIERISRNFK